MKISRSGNLRQAGTRMRMFVLTATTLGAIAGTATAQVALTDPRFDEVRKASVVWDNRPGPSRQVVDVVCLVPDVATFLETIGQWDATHFFPILIDDGEYSLKFLRAFRPSRIVRAPKKAETIAPESFWNRAVESVGRSWATEGMPEHKGDARPTDLGPLPPGIVVAGPDARMLAAAVALAAGHFQPLLQWSPPKHFSDDLPTDEAKDLALSLEAVIAAQVPQYSALGDDCDFVTMAADYPYSYRYKGEPMAVDDLILRSSQTGKRWAFAGRLVGDPVSSVYRAMCSLFLHPESALLDNTYDQKEPPWIDYRMTAASRALRKALPVTEREGAGADLAGWHQTLDPINPFGLILLNTHGSPNTFHLDGGPGQTADVPETGPTVLLMIHSFSAAAPLDPDTIAGRWLANGAFVFFGSMHEPFLQAFRTPTLAASFLAENLPVVVAERKLTGEIQFQPWRLVYFGDPLYRIRPIASPAERVASWKPIQAWPEYVEYQQPADDAHEALRLNWAVKTAVRNTQAGARDRAHQRLAGHRTGEPARSRLSSVV